VRAVRCSLFATSEGDSNAKLQMRATRVSVSEINAGGIVRDFKKLRVWQHAHPLVMATYRATEEFPAREIYGLTAQMRRAATSIGSNISEACGKPSDADFSRYLSIAFGSSSELKYQFLLSRDLGYMPDAVHDDLELQIDNVMRMLYGLMKNPGYGDKGDPERSTASSQRRVASKKSRVANSE
jgi:four helix bundle protein